MNNLMKGLLISAAIFIFFIPYTVPIHASNNSARNNNDGSSQYKRTVKKRKSDNLVILNSMPKSGKAREAGFDGKYTMESTTILDSDFTLCAKASRGLVMLDNAMLIKCGGRPLGWSAGPGKATKIDHSKHNM